MNLLGTKQTVHKLVLEAFVRPKVGREQCRHLDGDKTNNYYKNLMWGSARENASDRDVHNTTARGSKNGNSKLDELKVWAIRELYARTWVTHNDLAQIFDISRTNVTDIINNKTWKTVA